MAAVKPVRIETVPLKDIPDIDERWIRNRIEEDPSILGLGELEVRHRERVLPGRGRVDFVLEDRESGRRYVVEIQLGATDPSHIVRTIEYWDLERRRYPQYEHVAVLVAEEITGRFFNVISLLSSTIPLVAIRMTGVRLSEGLSLLFTRILDLSPIPQEEETRDEPVDQSYAEKRMFPENMQLVKRIVDILQQIDPSYTLNFTRSYIGIQRGGKPDKVIDFRYRKKPGLVMTVRLDRSDELDRRFDEMELDRLSYDEGFKRYQFRIHPSEFERQREVIRLALQQRGRLAEGEA